MSRSSDRAVFDGRVVSSGRRGVRAPLALTSNLHPARFDSIFPKGLATAAVDRLLHHAHIIVTEGRSHRLTEALDGRGVETLENFSADGV